MLHGKLCDICDTDDVTLPEEHVGLHWAFDAELEKLAGCVVAEKHLRQKAALLSLAERQGLLTSDSCFVEFGAGRGRLSYWLAKILAKDNCHFLLVDRAASRHKFENKAKSDLGDFPEIQRLQIDIRHLCLGNVHLVKAHQKKLIGLCKHLCGEATDLALRCLMETTRQPPGAESKASLGVHGVLMATCCHHRCHWDSFVGRPLLEAWGLGCQDFDLISSMAGWATCAARGQYNSHHPNGGALTLLADESFPIRHHDQHAVQKSWFQLVDSLAVSVDLECKEAVVTPVVLETVRHQALVFFGMWCSVFLRMVFEF
ncbi:hypothetical protein HPB49_006495 [Dermacentor silvarum]|uniref:Uncharacterized protein n=1 Tax=Dermacentor silvarum TaxID=543639 RepID=A0ACB8CDI4_DERSI|nr:hypothetical protein HPB49_006495 [Dermacentor silvarum]